MSDINKIDPQTRIMDLTVGQLKALLKNTIHNPDTPEKPISVYQAADLLKCHPNRIWAYIREGKLKKARPGYITRKSLVFFTRQ